MATKPPKPTAHVSLFRFWGTTCSPSSSSWRAWTSSRTTSPWWRTERSAASPSSPPCSSSTTDWGRPPRKSCSLCPASPTSVSTTTPGAASAHWTAWSGSCRYPAAATWATSPSAQTLIYCRARSWRSWTWTRCARTPTRWAAGQERGGDRGLHRSNRGQRPHLCVTPTCSLNLCWTAAAKVSDSQFVAVVLFMQEAEI